MIEELDRNPLNPADVLEQIDPASVTWDTSSAPDVRNGVVAFRYNNRSWRITRLHGKDRIDVTPPPTPPLDSGRGRSRLRIDLGLRRMDKISDDIYRGLLQRRSS